MAQPLEPFGLPAGCRKKGLAASNLDQNPGRWRRECILAGGAANFGQDGSVVTMIRELDSGRAQKFTTEEIEVQSTKDRSHRKFAA